MTRATKLTDEVSEAICAHARMGMPLVRAAALSRINRITAWRWQSEGAAEIDAADDDAELGPRARFALNYGEARAAYLLELSSAWKGAVDKKDANTAKVIAAMLSSQSPDEFSERRATRTQHTTLTGDVTVGRFDAMSDDDLHAEREKIAARRDAAQDTGADSWQAAAVRMPSQVGEEAQPERAAGENNSTPEKPKRSVSTIKRDRGPLAVGDDDLAQIISPTRARVSGAPVEAGRSAAQTDLPAPGHVGGGGVSVAGAPPSPPFPTSADDDEETKL